jgi:hypothetical protein
MADSNSRAESARDNILAFPARPKRGRVRKSESMNAAGELTLTLMLLAREGIEPPLNVALLQPPPEPTPVEKSPELALLLGIFGALDDKQKGKVRSTLRAAAAGVRCPHLAGACALIARDKGGC